MELSTAVSFSLGNKGSRAQLQLGGPRYGKTLRSSGFNSGIEQFVAEVCCQVNVVNADQCKKMPSTSSQHPRPFVDRECAI